MRSLIAVDIGNSVIKLAISQPDHEIQYVRFNQIADLSKLKFPIESGWVVCSVNDIACIELQKWITQHRPNDNLHVLASDDIPIETNVDNRQQVGRDRLVAAWKANQYRPENEAMVVVDAGTAVTIDLIDENSVFQGGTIFPGAATNLKSLSNSTAALPNLTTSDLNLEKFQSCFVGKNTADAMMCGVLHSQIFAITKIAGNLSDKNVVATGGQVELLADYLPGHWKIVPQLVLQGAIEIGQSIVSY
jgi:type III pantothenate kinase